MTNNILISREKRIMLHYDSKFIGMEGENLQEILAFQLDEDIGGTGIIEVEFPNGETGFIETEKTEQGYELPVKSSLLKQSGFVRFQLRIMQNNQEVFKSEIIRLMVRESINATATIPEEYPSWIDSLEKLKQNLETAENERISAENTRIASETARQSAETERDTNETNRISQENTRQSAETERVSAENIRGEKEGQRQTAEDTRVSNEQQRQNNETTRGTNETNRIQAENERAQAEILRANAENTREETFNQIIQATDEAVKEIEDKKEDYNQNASEKVEEYNKNTETKLNEYNSNAEAKLNEYNQNAQEKINEYNANSKELANRVVELEIECERLREDINNSTTTIADVGENLTLKNTVEARFKKFKIGGNSWQETGDVLDESGNIVGVMPSPESPSPIKNVVGNANITVCNQNFMPLDHFYGNETKKVNFNSFIPAGTYTLIYNLDKIVASPRVGFYIDFRGENSSARIFSPNMLSTESLGRKFQTFTLNFDVNSISTIVNNSSSVDYVRISDIQIVKGEYTSETLPNFMPHQSQTFTFPLLEGQKLMKGDYLADDGIHHKRKQYVFTGNEIFWIRATNQFYTNSTEMPFTNYKAPSETISNAFKYSDVTWSGKGVMSIAPSGALWLILDDNYNITTVDELKSYLAEQYANGTPVVLEYDLAEEEIEPYAEEQKIVHEEIQKTIKSYKGTTHIFCTNETSLIFDVEARKDQQAENDNLKNMIDNLSNAIIELGGNVNV